ncbi:hypothetical protein Gogos_000517 [Gossypium gossypioides]|uniref:Uncharacterized protein n=1 Tax=Gossypium gossypioides TaxID=34282 RepID=A0A7J9CTH8_GOSGO|nr:hypothetical protein [Gossypium gossypioides]
MANLNMVGVDLANLNIMDEEKDPLVVVGDDIVVEPEYGLCLVERVLTNNPQFTSLTYNGRDGTTIRGFYSKFMEYDASLVTKGISKFMQIRVVMDIRLPLKRKKRIGTGQNKSIYAFNMKNYRCFVFYVAVLVMVRVSVQLD